MTLTLLQIKLIIALLGLSVILVGGQVQQSFALGYQTGDVFVSVGAAKVEQWRDTGVMTLIQTIDCSSVFPSNSFTTGSTFDTNDHFYITMFDSDGVCHVDNNGVALGTFGSYGNDSPESILFDQSGNAYVGTVDGSTEDLYKKNSVGGALTQYDTQTSARGTDWIDLTAGQNIMYHTSEGREIFRHDVQNDLTLSDFASLPGFGHAFALRILSNGNVLVADNVNIKLLDGSGSVIGTYDKSFVDGWFALNISPDGVTFWSASFDNSNVCQFDIITGQGTDNELQCFTPSITGNVFGLSVFGEQTVGGPQNVIGGEILPINSVALMLAGIQMSAIWIVPVLAGAAGTAAFYLKIRKN